MLISHRHRFIFVKTRKSASTSVEISLSRFCDSPDDIITPVLPDDRKYQELAGVKAKNHLDVNGKRRFPGHAPARRIIKEIGKDKWDTYSSLCVVRNPWSRAVSQFHFRRRMQANPPSCFESFVREEQFTTELPMYAKNGKLLVDHIVKFEDLPDGLDRVLAKLGLHWDGWLPEANRTAPPREHYSSLYTPELVEIVAHKCRQEIALHGYRFDAVVPARKRGSRRPEIPPGDALDDGNAYNPNVLLGNQCKPLRRKGIREFQRDGHLFLATGSDAKLLQLNQAAREVWNLCDGTRSAEDIFRVLEGRYKTDAGTLSTDILIILDQLQQKRQIIAPDLVSHDGMPRKMVNLRDIVFYVISRQQNRQRRESIEKQLSDLGLRHEIVPGVSHGSKRSNIARAHLNVLEKENLSLPFAVLEDDCRFESDAQLRFDLPANADALYLGVSKFGSRIPGKLSRAKPGNVRFVPFGPNYLRVFNMFARHAIVYLSEGFRRAAVESVTKGFARRGDTFPGDAYYAMLHTSHMVLTPKHSICYQDKTFGGMQSATKFSLGSRVNNFD